MGSPWTRRNYMGVGIRYEKKVPRTLYMFTSLNFEDEIFVRGRGCNIALMNEIGNNDYLST